MTGALPQPTTATRITTMRTARPIADDPPLAEPRWYWAACGWLALMVGPLVVVF
jgi:hypothetical protein